MQSEVVFWVFKREWLSAETACQYVVIYQGGSRAVIIQLKGRHEH